MTSWPTTSTTSTDTTTATKSATAAITTQSTDRASNPEPPGRRQLAGIAAGLAAGALWGLVFVTPRMAEGFGSIELTAGRFSAYGAISAVALLATTRGRRLPSPAHALMAALLSVLGFSGYYLLLVLALRDAGTEVPTLIIGTLPLIITLAGKPHQLRWRLLLPGMALTLCGLLVMGRATLAMADATSAPAFTTGVAWAIAATACWTLFALLNASWLKRHPEVNATQWANWLGVATGLGAVALWAAAGPNLSDAMARSGWTLLAWMSVATGFGSAWLATILWNVAAQRLSTSLCGQLILSETLFALLYSFLWDKRWPAASQLIASALFALGIIASIRAHRDQGDGVAQASGEASR